MLFIPRHTIQIPSMLVSASRPLSSLSPTSSFLLSLLSPFFPHSALPSLLLLSVSPLPLLSALHLPLLSVPRAINRLTLIPSYIVCWRTSTTFLSVGTWAVGRCGGGLLCCPVLGRGSVTVHAEAPPGTQTWLSFPTLWCSLFLGPTGLCIF